MIVDIMWKKIKEIGAGAFGTVYLAENIHDDDSDCCLFPNKAAVKTIELTELSNEGEILKKVKGSPYVVEYYGEYVNSQEDTYDLVMEYADGGTLEDLIAGYEDVMPEPHVAWFTYMLLNGISHIHRIGVVHNDIKPANVLVFRGRPLNIIKLADFGLANIVSPGKPNSVKLEEEGDEGRGLDMRLLGNTVVAMMSRGRHASWREEWCVSVDIPDSISKSAQDFLMKCYGCFGKTWSADGLLKHPFIKKNVKKSSNGLFFTPAFETQQKPPPPPPPQQADEFCYQGSKENTKVHSSQLVEEETSILPNLLDLTFLDLDDYNPVASSWKITKGKFSPASRSTIKAATSQLHYNFISNQYCCQCFQEKGSLPIKEEVSTLPNLLDLTFLDLDDDDPFARSWKMTKGQFSFSSRSTIKAAATKMQMDDLVEGIYEEGLIRSLIDLSFID